MWFFILLGLGAAGALVYDKYALHSQPSTPALPQGSPPLVPTVTPGLPAIAAFPIPNAAKFATAMVSQNGLGVNVAAFGADTRQAMANALSAREWRVVSALSDQILSIAPPDLANAANVDALSAIRIAAAGGFNVYADADLAQKLAGNMGAPDPSASANFIALSKGIPTPDPVTDDGTTGNEEVALTPAAATEAIQDDFPGSRFVLFVPAGVQV